MNAQLTDLEGGVVIDESHHIPYVVWSSAVERLVVAQDVAGSNPVTPPITAFRFTGERLVVAQDVAGSNPVTPPITAFRFTGERFTEPLRLRGYQIDVLRQLRGLSGIRPVVAQLVERRPEEPGVAGSTPARGTKLKL